MQIRPATAADQKPMLDLWERSVRATHSFVSAERVAELKPLVDDYLSSAKSSFCVIVEDADVLGFMGMQGNKIEAIFLTPERLRQGLGSQMVNHAKAMHDSLDVDVNEENESAIAFYHSQGFKKTGRSEFDDQGNPHPLLHLSY